MISTETPIRKVVSDVHGDSGSVGHASVLFGMIVPLVVILAPELYRARRAPALANQRLALARGSRTEAAGSTSDGPETSGADECAALAAKSDITSCIGRRSD